MVKSPIDKNTVIKKGDILIRQSDSYGRYTIEKEYVVANAMDYGQGVYAFVIQDDYGELNWVLHNDLIYNFSVIEENHDDQRYLNLLFV